MKKKLPYWWAICYGSILIGFTIFVLLKTFVIRSGQVVEARDNGIYLTREENGFISKNETLLEHNNLLPKDIKDYETKASSKLSKPTASDSTYKDDNICIKVLKRRINDTNIYIADVKVSSVAYLKTALAENMYGRNIKETTSQMAIENKAILAINGDYYGFRDTGYVLRNGMLYRADYDNRKDEAFVVYEDGRCETINESEKSAESLLEDGAVQILSFGPGLIKDNEICVSQDEEIKQARNSNPRTSIGMISPLHYIFLVSDGRTAQSTGLTLYQLAQIMKENGCSEAYNLDGGGSSTLWFRGQVFNNPTDGRKAGEREVSDIVYIG